MGLVLYGGTAIALRLGHRTSVDFDFFSEAHLDHAAIRSAFLFMESCTVLQDTPNALTVLAQGVKISFFGNIRFGRVGVPEMTEDGVLQVASLEDLMATKLKVILQRAEAKDYRDIAAMVGSGVDVAQGLAAARLFFGNSFQPSESIKAMTYFGDGDLHTLTQQERQTLQRAASTVRTLPTVASAARQLQQ